MITKHTKSLNLNKITVEIVVEVKIKMHRSTQTTPHLCITLYDKRNRVNTT